MLTSKGNARVWLVGETLQAAASDRGRVVDDIKTNNKYPIVNSEDFNYRFSQLETALNTQKNSIPCAGKRKWRLISKWWRRRKQRMHIGEKDANGKQMTHERRL